MAAARGPHRHRTPLVVGHAVVGRLDRRLHRVRLVRRAAPRLPRPQRQDLMNALQPPSMDTRSAPTISAATSSLRILHAGQVDLTFAVITTYIPFVLGRIVGALAGYVGGWIDAVIIRIVDIVVSFPFIVLILAIIAITGPGLTGAYIGVFAVGWALYARLTRGEMLVERQKEYILARRDDGLLDLAHHLPPRGAERAAGEHRLLDVGHRPQHPAAGGAFAISASARSRRRRSGARWCADGKEVILTSWWVSTLPGLVIVLVGDRLQPDRRRPRRPHGQGLHADRRGGRSERAVCSRSATSRRASPRRREQLLAGRPRRLKVEAGRTVGLLGESGCGKSVTLRSLLGMVPSPARSSAADPLGRRGPRRGPRKQRAGRHSRPEISMIFQDPAACLNPVFTIGDQMTETLRKRAGLGKRDGARARDRAARSRRHRLGRAAPFALPARVQRRHAPARDDRDRDLGAAGAAARRRADHGARRHHPGADPRPADGAPGTRPAWRSSSSRTISASIAETCDEVVVMYAGRMLEAGYAAAGDALPRHPYTHGLIAGDAVARGHARRVPPAPIPGQPPNLAALPPGLPVPAALRLSPARSAPAIPVTLDRNLEQHGTACPFVEQRPWRRRIESAVLEVEGLTKTLPRSALASSIARRRQARRTHRARQRVLLRRAGRDPRHRRRVGQRQVDARPLHRPARRARRGLGRLRRPGRRSAPARASSAPSAARSR